MFVYIAKRPPESVVKMPTLLFLNVSGAIYIVVQNSHTLAKFKTYLTSFQNKAKLIYLC